MAKAVRSVSWQALGPMLTAMISVAILRSFNRTASSKIRQNGWDDKREVGGGLVRMGGGGMRRGAIKTG